MRKIKPNADGPKIHCLYDELIDPKTLKYHPKNRNKHPKDQIERLAKILEYQGWRYPIKVSKLSGCVTSGHGRIAAAFLKKWTQVPVVFQEYENADQEYADVQSDNAIASWAELDLAGINLDVPDLGPDFDINMLGIKAFVIEPADFPTLEDRDHCGVFQMAFQVTADQKEKIEKALAMTDKNLFDLDANQNKNANALEQLVDYYLGAHTR